MWDGFNQRKFPRIKLNCEVTLNAGSKNKALITGITENVGIGGICMIQNVPLERFSQCQLRLELTSDAVIDCKGKVVWAIERQDKRAEAKSFDTGIEFVDLSPEDSSKLKSFLESKISPENIVK